MCTDLTTLKWHRVLGPGLGVFIIVETCLPSYVGFEVFTVVTMKNAVFWDGALCGFTVSQWRLYVPLKHQFIINPHDTTSRKMAFFMVTKLLPSNEGGGGGGPHIERDRGMGRINEVSH
jgi:hypothetical protein